MLRTAIALVVAVVASVAIASPPPPPHGGPMIQTAQAGPPRYDLQRALAMAYVYAAQHAIRIDKAGYLQAGVFDLDTRNWVFDWMSPTGRMLVITVHEDGTIVSN